MQTNMLVVEDSATQALALCEVLVNHGFAVERVANGEAALEYLASHTVDLVLSDIVMPGISGYELCRRIKADPDLASLPVVLLTSLSDPVDIVRGLECGADNYVTKPYEPQYLCARIQHVLDRQRLRRAPKASLGVSVSFLGTTFSINSDKEQILDLFISSVEEVVRTNSALQESQRELAQAQARLEEHARGLAQQARVSAEKSALLMHEANDAILVLDVNGHILEANVSATELFARSESDLRGHALEAFAAPRSAAEVRAQFARLGRTPRVEANEIAFVDATGRGFTCNFSASRTTSGVDQWVLVILHDVTEHQATAERLRKSEAWLAESQQIAGLGSWELDLVTGDVQWSTELYRLLGLEPGGAAPVFRDFVDHVHPADRKTLRDRLDALSRTGRPFDLEFRIVRDDGEVRFMRARAEVHRDDRGRPGRVRGVIQDVSDHRQLQEQLHQAQKMEAVGQLAGGVAHDFNNLLTVVTSYCGILLAELPPDDETRADIEEIKLAADRAAALTRQLLAFSRRQILQPQVVDIASLTHQLEKLLRRLVREDIEIVTAIEPDIGSVWADPNQLEQVLVNLVVNARDAMPDGGTLTIRASADERRPDARASDDGAAPAPGRRVLLEVSDTGTGMSPEVQARIFEPFYTTKEPGKGTGLGLSTVYGIVQQSSGEIAVESAPGAGTRFRIYLPCREESPESTTRSPAATPARAGGETILLVEDDDALRTVACRILRRQGYTVLEARNGREALELCEQHSARLQLVVTDMVMPEMGGRELGQGIAARHPQTRVLYMSGYTRDSMVREGIAHDGTAYLEKPFTPDGLLAKVRDILRGGSRRA